MYVRVGICGVCAWFVCVSAHQTGDREAVRGREEKRRKREGGRETERENEEERRERERERE